MAELLNVDDALERILSLVPVLSNEEVSLTQALQRVLAEHVQARINLPPFANSSMDGYAVRSADVVRAGLESGVSLSVIMDIPAGTVPNARLEAGQAARIMTGAPMPEGADAVVPVEDTDGVWDKQSAAALSPTVKIYKAVGAGDFVRPVGEDFKIGTQLLAAGTVLRAQEIGVLAALGQVTVPVYRQPKVAILSSGDELIDVADALTPGKIRNVNSHTLAALVTQMGGIPVVLPVARDTEASIRGVFGQALELHPDMIISSAGVSVGAADLIRDILEELGAVNFWRINLRPGKPLAFGTLQGIPFMGLPGNPVSAMVTFDVLVRPALRKMAGREETLPLIMAELGESLRSDGRRSYIRVKLALDGKKIIATTTGTQSSGALMSMVLADGLLIIPEAVKWVEAGTRLPVRVLRLEKLYALLGAAQEAIFYGE